MNRRHIDLRLMKRSLIGHFDFSAKSYHQPHSPLLAQHRRLTFELYVSHIQYQ